jgi:catechol 2,3-dioxygenase-like lactoylglutathione lyase family enzyme
MAMVGTRPRVIALAPQFLVHDLDRAISYYRRLGFIFGEPWGGYYAIGVLDGLELHLKETRRDEAERPHPIDGEHVDAYAGVEGIEALYERCITNGVTLRKPLTATAWGTREFCVEDPEGNVICFGGLPAADLESSAQRAAALQRAARYATTPRPTR